MLQKTDSKMETASSTAYFSIYAAIRFNSFQWLSMGNSVAEEEKKRRKSGKKRGFMDKMK